MPRVKNNSNKCMQTLAERSGTHTGTHRSVMAFRIFVMERMAERIWNAYSTHVKRARYAIDFYETYGGT